MDCLTPDTTRELCATPTYAAMHGRLCDMAAVLGEFGPVEIHGNGCDATLAFHLLDEPAFVQVMGKRHGGFYVLAMYGEAPRDETGKLELGFSL